MEIKFEQAKSLKEKPTGSLGFGKYYTDYMFVCDWDQELVGMMRESFLMRHYSLIRHQWYCIMHRKHLKD